MTNSGIFDPRTKSILIVDDEEDLRDYVASLLEPEGYQLEFASSGNSAWNLLHHQEVDLVLTDVIMPDGDGIQLLDRIKDKNRERPAVFLMSGYAKISVPEAYERGAEAFFPKPFKAEPLVEAIRNALMPKLDRWQQRRSERFPHNDLSLNLNVTMPDLLTAAYSASILNIGRGGMFLAWGSELPNVGDSIKFEITFLGEPGKKFAGSGVVRWIRDERDQDNRLPGLGVEFTQLESDQAIDIMEVLNFLKTKEFIPRS